MIYKVSLIFYHAHPIIIKVTLSFLKFVSACFINPFLRYSRFQILKTQKATSISDQHNAKIIKVTFKFPEFLSTDQKSAYSIDFLLRYSQFQCPETRVGTPILTIPMPIFFNQLLISINLHQQAKNQAFSSFCSRDIVS